MPKDIPAQRVVQLIAETATSAIKELQTKQDADNGTLYKKAHVYQGGILAIEIFTKRLIDGVNKLASR